VRNAAAAGAAALVTAFGVVAALYPWSLMHLARRTFAMRELAGNAAWGSKVASFWLGRSGVPLLGVTFACAAACLVLSLWRNRRTARLPVLAWAALVVAAAYAVRNS